MSQPEYDQGNQWSGKKLSVRLQQIRTQWINLGERQQGMLDNLIISAELLEEKLERALPSERTANAEPFEEADPHVALYGDQYDKANWPSKEVLDGITQGRETGYALGLRDATSERAVDDAMIDRALEAAKGAMVDTRRFWTEGDRAAVRDMLIAALRGVL